MNKIFKDIAKNEYFQKYQIFIIPAASVGISLILLFLIIVPQVMRFFDSDKILTEANQKYDQLNTKIDVLEEINSSEYKKDIDTSLLALPPDQDIPNAVGQIIYLLSSNNLQLVSLGISTGSTSTGTKPSGSQTENYTIKVETVGSTTSLQNFILKLKESPRIMKVDGVELSQDRLSGRVQAVISLQIYYKNLPTTIGGVESSVTGLTAQEQALLRQIEEYARKIPTTATASGNVRTGKEDPFR